MKKEFWNNFLKISIKVLLLFFGFCGLFITFGASGFMGSGTALLYFTIQSNITIMAIVLVFLIADIVKICSGKTFVNNTLKIIKFVFTIAITITFLVFFIILAPTMKISYLVSFGNLTVHFLVPLLAIIDMFLFDFDVKFKKGEKLWAISMPLYYLIFALTLSFFSTSFDGQKVPYYFMDWEKLGWFKIGKNGIGVVYWIAILVVTIIGLIYLFAYLLNLKNKKGRIK